MESDLSHEDKKRDHREVVGTEDVKDITNRKPQGGIKGDQGPKACNAGKGHDKAHGHAGEEKEEEEKKAGGSGSHGGYHRS